MLLAGPLPSAARCRARLVPADRLCGAQLLKTYSRLAIRCARNRTSRGDQGNCGGSCGFCALALQSVRPRRPRGARTRRSFTRYCKHLCCLVTVINRIRDSYSILCINIGLQKMGWRQVIIVPISPPILLCVRLRRHASASGCCYRCEIILAWNLRTRRCNACASMSCPTVCYWLGPRGRTVLLV